MDVDIVTVRANRISQSLWSAIFALLFACLNPASAQAQAVNTYTNTTSGVISSTVATCAAPLTRTFTVSTSYVVDDVNIGTLISHPQRGDLRVTLRSPTGTTARVFNRTGGAADHINALFDDEGTTTIAAYTANAALTPAPPPYQTSLIPSAALSIFDGENALGTWQVEICDNIAANDGTFLRSDLTITAANTNYADLSLAKTVSNAAPANGAAISYTLTLANSAVSSLTAASVTVRDVLPAGATFVSATGTGTYSAGTGIWTAGSIAPGTSVQMQINVTVNATSGAVVTNSAEITTSSETDPNSVPGNGSTTEDDDAAVNFTVAGTRTAGTAPTLICPVGSSLFNWNNFTWTAGTVNNSYSLLSIGSISFALSTDVAFVAGSPTVNANLTGGMAATETSLFQNLNNTSVSNEARTVVTLPTAVPGLQFRILDIDFGAGSFADKITVTGSFNGSAVSPTLTNGISNYITGNTAIGDAGSGDTTADGTVVVTFPAPVDTITIRYGNHITAPADPGNQWMAIHDITICKPVANLSVTKLSSVVSDNVSVTNPKSIPGAIVRYCILVSNAGSGTATDVSASDPVPADLTFIPGSMYTGPNCTSASAAEDEDAAGPDETDTFGMSFTGTIVTGTAPSLAPAASFALVFNATVN
jgi:uncharacterized repeat protein (TIGR01451 family)